jgi:hypothetical protein
LLYAQNEPLPTPNPALRRDADGAEIPSPSNPLPFRSVCGRQKKRERKPKICISPKWLKIRVFSLFLS